MNVEKADVVQRGDVCKSIVDYNKASQPDQPLLKYTDLLPHPPLVHLQYPLHNHIFYCRLNIHLHQLHRRLEHLQLFQSSLVLLPFHLNNQLPTHPPTFLIFALVSIDSPVVTLKRFYNIQFLDLMLLYWRKPLLLLGLLPSFLGTRNLRPSPRCVLYHARRAPTDHVEWPL